MPLLSIPLVYGGAHLPNLSASTHISENDKTTLCPYGFVSKEWGDK